MISFERMRVSARLLIAGFSVFLGLAVIASYTLMEIRSEAIDAHTTRIKDLVESSMGIVGNYQKLEADKKLSREEAQLQAKEALRTLRFGNDDYYFLYDFEGRALMVAGNPKIEGQVMLGKTDVKGFKLWDAFVAIAKGPGKGSVEYWFPRAGQTEPKPKLAYLSAIPEWQWIVGTGVYIDDVDAAVRKAAINYVVLSLIILAAAAALGVLVSRSIVNQLGGEPQEAADSMRRIAGGDLGIEITTKEDDDKSLMASLKLMQLKLVNITSTIQENASTLSSQVQSFDGVAKTYAESKSVEDLSDLNRAAKKLGKTADMLNKSISRFRL
jgi:methyl-accepting chemotaxis protein